jgi:hypothetical protein
MLRLIGKAHVMVHVVMAIMDVEMADTQGMRGMESLKEGIGRRGFKNDFFHILAIHGFRSLSGSIIGNSRFSSDVPFNHVNRVPLVVEYVVDAKTFPNSPLNSTL